MRKILAAFLSIFLSQGAGGASESKTLSSLKNEKIHTYTFLKEMSADDYFPNFLVDKGKQILIDLCWEIESQQPKTEAQIYALTHAATERFNVLEEEFHENDSEIETAARDDIGTSFAYILEAYGFDLDIEEAIAPRNW